MSAKNEEGRSRSVSLESEKEMRPLDEGPAPLRSSSSSSSVVDDDQDRRNPQYIPKRGVFYEHDDRIESDEEEEGAAVAESEGKQVQAKKALPPNRRLPKSEAASRWGHDKFAEMDQAPKTKDELVSVYGYDIRNEDTAPRARRRRKYGRGPNKYTRKWENEDAYVKSSLRGTSHKGSRGGGSLVMKKTGKRADEEMPPAPESKEFPPIKKEPVPKPKEVGHKKEKARPEGKNGNAAILNEPRVEHIEKTLSRTHISSSNNNKSSVPPRKSQEKNSSTPPSTITNVEAGAPPSKPKRYSTQRQRHNANTTTSNPTNPSRKEETPTSDPNYYKRGSTAFTPKSSSEYPTTSVAYSNSTPFATSTTGGFSRSSAGGGGQTQSVPPPYMNPNGLVNYGPPPPVQYTVPVTVPVTVPLTMSLVPPQADTFSGVPLVPGPTTSNPPLLPPAAHHIGAPELIAAAALGGGVPAGNGAPPNTGYAEVRGGVTYFNPTAQAPVLMRPVNKRPKAAIPIIDPSNLSVEKTQASSEGLTRPTSSTTDKSNVDIMTSNNNELLT